MINYNGDIKPKGKLIFPAQNRAFRYGDGIFETIRMFEGELLFWDQHWIRLKQGAKYLKLQGLKGPKFFKKEILKLCEYKGNYRIRITIFRQSGGLYTPEKMECHFLIEAEPIQGKRFKLNKKGAKIGVCREVQIPRTRLSNLKTINALPYVLAGIFKTEHQLDDCILLNDLGQVAEASSSNIFIIRDKTLYTPPLDTGCKAGTLRQIILSLAPELKLRTKEKPLKIKHLLKAEEIWLTNAIQGIRWVEKFKQNKQLDKDYALKMVFRLNQLIEGKKQI